MHTEVLKEFEVREIGIDSSEGTNERKWDKANVWSDQEYSIKAIR